MSAPTLTSVSDGLLVATVIGYLAAMAGHAVELAARRAPAQVAAGAVATRQPHSSPWWRGAPCS